MSRKINIHSHLILPGLMGLAGETGPEIIWHDDGRASMRIGDRFTKLVTLESAEEEKILGARATAEKVIRQAHDPHVRIAEMDAAGVDVMGITNNAQMYFYGLDAAINIRFQAKANDLLAEYCETAPERFFFMATLPLQDLQASARELDRAIKLGAKGVHVGAHSLGGHELYDEALWPLFGTIAEAGLPLFVHPYPFQLAGVAPTRFSGPMLEFPYQSSIAVTHLILGGVLDAFPALKICISHGGGFIPYQFGRIEAFARLKPEMMPRRPLRDYLPQFYFDNLIHEPQARRFLVDWMGVGNIMVGDNYLGLDSADGFAFLDELGLPPEAAAAIAGHNAEQVFGL